MAKVLGSLTPQSDHPSEMTRNIRLETLCGGGMGQCTGFGVVASQYAGGAEMVVAQCAIGAAGQASRFPSRRSLLLRQHVYRWS
jgi:hypothetical protein